MSNIETKTLFRGDTIRAEALADGTPLARPINIKLGLTGWYISCEDAERIAAELVSALCAVAAEKKKKP